MIDQRYRVEEIIGRGGMGCIVRARQLTMDRDVAVKLLHPHVADDESTVARFKREVHLAKSLAHPNIIQYYDFGSLPDGSLYLVMELLEGKDLHAEIRQKGPLSVHRSIDVILQVLDGLAEAHARSVVHRDLKPRNLFLLERNRRGDFVKILDFGIAKSTQATETELTRTGVVCGTPSYLAPELLITQQASPASDLYSVGLILLEMLSGRRVFKADTMARTFFMQLRHPVPIPPRFADTPLHDVLLYSMAKHPADRFQSAEEMIDELEFVLKRMPQDFRLDEDDIQSMSESISSQGMGMSGIDKMGLDVLRDPSWAITPTPLPLRAEANGDTVADILPDEKATVPDRAYVDADTTFESPADELIPESRSKSSSNSRSRTRLFVGGAVVATLLVAAGIAVGSNFVDDDRLAEQPAGQPAPSWADRADPSGQPTDKPEVGEVMDFAVEEEPYVDEARPAEPRRSDNDRARRDEQAAAPQEADRANSDHVESGSTEPKPRDSAGSLDLDRGLPADNSQAESGSKPAKDTSSSERTRRRTKKRTKRRSGSSDEARDERKQGGENALDDIMKDNTIMGDEGNDLF